MKTGEGDGRREVFSEEKLVCFLTSEEGPGCEEGYDVGASVFFEEYGTKRESGEHVVNVKGGEDESYSVVKGEWEKEFDVLLVHVGEEGSGGG